MGRGVHVPSGNGLFPSFTQGEFLKLWTQEASTVALPKGSLRLSESRGRTLSGPKSPQAASLSDRERTAPICFPASGVTSGRQACPCWPPPRPHAGPGLPTLFPSGPRSGCCWCPPQGPPAPMFTRSCPSDRHGSLLPSLELSPGPSKLRASECRPRGWSARVWAFPSPTCVHENSELEAGSRGGSVGTPGLSGDSGLRDSQRGGGPRIWFSGHQLKPGSEALGPGDQGCGQPPTLSSCVTSNICSRLLGL